MATGNNTTYTKYQIIMHVKITVFRDKVNIEKRILMYICVPTVSCTCKYMLTIGKLDIYKVFIDHTEILAFELIHT